MNFQRVADTLLVDFEREQIRYAAIGGFALGFWGAARATLDMDFLLLADDVQRVERIMAGYLYQPVYKTDNVGQYRSELADYGSIDFIFAFRDASTAMLQRSVEVQIDRTRVRTLMPEDLIGLKVQAMANDKRRATRDLADIEALLEARCAASEAIDWSVLQEYFALFDMLDTLAALQATYGNSDRHA